MPSGKSFGNAERWKALGWTLSGGSRWDVLLPVRFGDEEASDWAPGRGWEGTGDLQPSPCHPWDTEGWGWGGLCRAPPSSIPRFSLPDALGGDHSPLDGSWTPPCWSLWWGDIPLALTSMGGDTPLHPTAYA